MIVSLTLVTALLLPLNGQGKGHSPSHPSSPHHPFHPHHPHHAHHPGHFPIPPGHAPCPPKDGPFGAPEIDGNLGRAGFVLLAGGALLLLGRRRSAVEAPKG